MPRFVSRLVFSLFATVCSGCGARDDSVRPVTPAVDTDAKSAIVAIGRAWTVTLPIRNPATLHVAPDGGVLAIEDGRALSIVDARSGTPRAHISIVAGSNVALANDVVLVQRAGALTAYAFDGRLLWRRPCAALLGAGDRTAFASGPTTLSAIDASTGVVRWTANVDRDPDRSVADILPGDEPVIASTTGEPLVQSVTAFDSTSGSMLWTSGDGTYLTTIDGIALTRTNPFGDGYRPPGLDAVAAKGGRFYFEDRAFAPDKPRFTRTSSDFGTYRDQKVDDTIVADDRFVYVGVEGVLFRYPRDADPASLVPLELDGLAMDGLVVGRRFITMRNGVAYEVTPDDTAPELLPVSPLSAHADDLAAHTPYLTYRTTPRTWFATDVERPGTQLRFDLPCQSDDPVTAATTIVFACRTGSAITIAGYTLPRLASRDGELRDTGAPFAAATPLPEADAPSAGPGIPIDVHVPAARSRSDFRPRIVSPAARSIVTTLDRTVTGTRDLHWLASGCRSEGDGFTCAASLPFPLTQASASHTVGATIFDGPGGTGNALARGALRVVTDGTAQTVALGLGGIPATLELEPAGTLHRGRAAALPIAVIARDADGYPILNTAPYDVPVSIALLEAPGRTSLSTTLVTHPNGRVILRYDGSPVDTIVVTASAPNSAATSIRIPVTRD